MNTDLIAFNNMLRRVSNPELINVTIVESDSGGNSVLLNPINTLFDLGLPYNHYPKDFFYQVEWIVLTHPHGDHFNQATLEHVMRLYPHIKVIWPSTLTLPINQQYSDRIIQVTTEPAILNGRDRSMQLTPYVVKHGDIQNTVYAITLPNFYQVLYATDLEQVNELPNTQFDFILLEANYDADNMPKDGIRYGNYRHMSEQASFNYVHQHLNEHGVFIPLHGSPEFGTYHQPILAVDDAI